MSALPHPIETVLWPYRAVGRRGAVLAVLLTAAVCAGSLFVAADAVAASVSGTTTIENPDRPPEWACEQRQDSEMTTLTACGQPAEIDVSLSRHASGAILGLVPGVFVALGGLWLFFTGLLAGGDARFREVLWNTAWALPPLALPAVVRAGVAVRTAPAQTWPGSLDALASDAKLFALGETSTVVTAASVVAVLWIGAVLYGVGRDRVGTDGTPLAPLVAGLLVVAVGIPLDAPAPDLLLVGVGIAVVSLPFVFVPRLALLLSARTELIGYRGSDQVEPRNWYVQLNRLLGLGGFAVGLLFAWLPAYLV